LKRELDPLEALPVEAGLTACPSPDFLYLFLPKKKIGYWLASLSSFFFKPGKKTSWNFFYTKLDFSEKVT